MTLDIEIKTSPFLKWAGGKRWLIKNHPDIFPNNFSTYYEPFLGGGAVFFHLQPKNSVLSDKNPALINLYEQVKCNHKLLESELKNHQERHCKEYYYHIRSSKFESKIEQAAQFLYLNRTCWNGLFRVNLKGIFNVPIGTKNTVLIPGENFNNLSDRLRNSEILATDFGDTINRAREGDLIFADPPYTVKHNTNGFIKYNESIFSWEDQERLAESLEKAAERGVKIISTNADHASVRALYKGKFQITALDRASVLAGKKTARGNTTEILITNFTN